MLPVHRAIRKYGMENCSFVYIYQNMPKEYILRLEIAFIKNYDTTNYVNGYNVSPGGDSWSPPPTVRTKISESNKAFFATLTPEERKARAAHLKIINTEAKRSPEVCAKNKVSANKPRTYSNEYSAASAARKKAWWDARKAAGLTGNIAYIKNPDLRPPLKEKPKRDKPWQRLKPVSDEHREKVAQKRREWWAAKKAAGLTSFEDIMGKPKKGGYKLTFTEEHKAKLSASKKAFYAKQKELLCP